MSTPNPPSLGAMLREARERAALSIDDVSERTRIRATLIREIEADDFRGCGGNFYARGHVRSIATTLGADPGPFVNRFNMQAEMTMPTAMPVLPPYEPRSHGKQGRAARSPKPPPPTRVYQPPAPPMASAAPMAPSSPPARLSRQQRSGPNWTSAMLVAAAVVAILAVGSFALATLKRPIQQVDAHQPQIHATSAPSTAASPKPPPPPSPTPAAQTGVNLRLQVTQGSSWVRVMDGSGRSIFEGVLATGDIKEFSDPRSLTVRYGNASAITVVLNGQDRGSPESSCGGTVCTERYVPGPAAG